MFRALDQRRQKFYNTVAKMVSNVNSKRSTIKSQVYGTQMPERYHALLHKVLVNYPVLRDLVKKTEFMKNVTLGAVVAYEVLTKRIKNDGYRRRLKRALGDAKLVSPVVKTFVRINTLKGKREDLDGFKIKETCIPDVYELLDGEPDAADELESYDSNADDLDDETGDVETYDDETADEETDDEENAQNEIPAADKPVYKRVKDLQSSDLLEKIKIQNFSSCLPAFILNPEPGSTVIDATAAPGNKTTHLCSIMKDTGKIYAFERDAKRYQTLVEQVGKYGATNIETIHSDFLKVKPEDYKVDYILLDPSCSGSGIHINYVENEQRLNKLGNFQAMMVNHAMKFGPKAIVYSACSYHKRECEDVVKEVLEKNPNYELEMIPEYTGQRGHSDYEFADKVLRTTSDDNTGYIGFFVALFKRRE